MISSKKSVKKKDRIKYFKEIVEMDINFNLKHRKQKIIVQWSMKQLSRKEKLEEKKNLICTVLNLEYFYHLIFTKSRLNVFLFNFEVI